MQTVTECVPSRFIDEIPAGLVELHEPSAEINAEQAAAMKKRFDGQ